MPDDDPPEIDDLDDDDSSSASAVSTSATTVVLTATPTTLFTQTTLSPKPTITGNAVPADSPSPSSSPTSVSLSPFPTYQHVTPSPAPTDNPFDSREFWDRISDGTQAGIIISVIIGLTAIIIASIWCCCCRPRRRARRQRESLKLEREREAGVGRMQVPGASLERLPVPLRTMDSRNGADSRTNTSPSELATSTDSSHLPPHPPPNAIRDESQLSRTVSATGQHLSLRGGADAPPRYEEVVPLAHQRLAGGMRSHSFGHEEEEDGMGVISDGKTPLSEIPFEDVIPESASSESSSSRNFGSRHAEGGGNTSGHTNS